jgi:uncharacterized protein YjbJ (UPF0337 family)
MQPFNVHRRRAMNRSQIEGKWNELKGEVRTKWGKLTDDDLSVIGGKFETLVGRLQQRYGYQKEQAEREADDFINGIDVKRRPTDKH